MIDNSGLFKGLLDSGNIRIHNSPLFHEALTPLPAAFSFDKIEGMLLGVAIGDALGAPTEGLGARDRYNQVCQRYRLAVPSFRTAGGQFVKIVGHRGWFTNFPLKGNS